MPGDVDRHVLLGGTGQHPEQLIQGGGQELDHHMALHGMQTLRVKHHRGMLMHACIMRRTHVENSHAQTHRRLVNK